MSSLVGHSLRRHFQASTVVRSQRQSWLERAGSPGYHCCLSSTSSNLDLSSASSATEKQKRIPKSLYRQLLRWCDSTDPRVPLGSFLDPIQVGAPHVDKQTLELFKQYKNHEGIYHMNPPKVAPDENQASSEDNSHVDKAYFYLPQSVKMADIDTTENKMKVSIHNTEDLKGLVKTMFRANALHPGDEEVRQERVTYGLDAVWKLNQLTEAIETLNQERDSHRQRKEVLFRVGQVVQHKSERWRGVVIGWKTPSEADVVEDETEAKAAGDALNSVQYEVLLDRGDIHVRDASAPMLVSVQEDLEQVTDPSLCRIWNSQIPKHFKGYKAQSNTFQMNDYLAYKYPVDHAIQQLQQLLENEVVNGDEPYQIDPTAVEELGFGIDDIGLQKLSDAEVESVAKETVSKVKEFTRTICDFLSKEINQRLPSGSGMDGGMPEELVALEAFREKFDFSGDLPPSPGANADPRDASPIASAAACMHEFLKTILKLREVLWHRKKLQEAKNVQFELGQVVKNEYLGFRGVVVGIDPRPKVDVSQWAGTEHLENPEEQPFYYIYPDMHDALSVFGFPFGERYVCQGNLRACQGEERDVSISMKRLAPGWRKELEIDGIMAYIPPSLVKFKHGVDIGDSNLTEECLTKVELAISSWQLHAKENKGCFPGDLVELLGASQEEALDCRVSLLDLMKLLRGSRTMVDAITFDEAVKDIFKAHPDSELRRKLEEGTADHLRGNHQSALETFQSLVAHDTEYGEAWNKIATSQCIMGQYSCSVETSKKAAVLQPLNFQAFHGAGISEFEQGNYENAAALFRQCLALNPWSSIIATKLAATVDLLERPETERLNNVLAQE